MSSHPYVQNFLATLEEERITSSIDWTEELLLAIEAGDCRAADIAWSRAGVLVQEEAIESLLLNALCAGKVIDAYQAAGILGRDLREDEVMVLTEMAILTGNITGMCILATSTFTQEMKAFLHSSMLIAVARHIKLKNGVSLPPPGITGTWCNLYKKEMEQLGVQGNYFYTKLFPSGRFLILTGKSRQRLLGYLLAHELISQGELHILDQ